jgi:predicted transport protein
MTDPIQKALETQLSNIQTKTGKSLAALTQFAQASGLTKHGQLRDLFKRDFGLGHGDANTLAHYVRQGSDLTTTAVPVTNLDRVLDELYSGPKAALRPIHEKLMAAIDNFGDFTSSPKKSYVSLRRKKQFVMIGPATKTQVEVGLNVKDLADAERLTVVPAGGMCNYKIRLTDAVEVDDQLVGWLRQAYEGAN